MAGAGGLLRRFARSRRGVAAIEFATFAPLLLLMLLGGFDLSRYLSRHSKVGQVGFAVADVAGQYETLTPSALAQVFRITGNTLPDYVAGRNGVTILSSVYLDKTSKKAKVSWQCASAATTKWTSKVGGKGGNADVPPGLLIDDASQPDNIIVSEVYYQYEPVFAYYFTDKMLIYSRNYFRPRLGSLLTSPC